MLLKRVFALLLCIVLSSVAGDLLQPGTRAPKFSLPTIEGRRETLRNWCGDTLRVNRYNKEKHFIILSFWATWCMPCRREVPVLHSFMEKHADKNVKTFLISLDKGGATEVIPFVEEQGWTLPILLDKYGVTARSYGVSNKKGLASVPSLVVMDTSLNVLYSASGFEETEEEFIQKLESIIWPATKASAPSQQTQ